MKRVISLLCTLTLVFTLIPPIAVQAETAEPVNATIEVSYDGIQTFAAGEEIESDNSLEKAGKTVREAMKARTASVKVTYKSNDKYSEEYVIGLAENIFSEALIHTGVPTEGDYLKYQYDSLKCDIEAEGVDGDLTITITYNLEYYNNAEQEAEVDRAVAELIASEISEDMSDYEKISAFYRYICNNVAYDYENKDNDEYKLKWTAYDAIINNSAVCQGYAVLMYRLLLEEGIDCRIIAGDSLNERHTWNIVKIGDAYYNLDSTWDAGCYEYSYFLKGNETFLDHERDDEFETAEFMDKYVMGEEDYVYQESGGDEPGDDNEDGDQADPSEEFTFTVSNDKATLIKYSGKASVVEVPDKYEGATVTAIGYKAFYDNDYIKTVKIPAGVTKINDGYLDQMVYPYVHYGAFSECDSLETVEIAAGSKLSHIGEWAFCGSEKFSEINLPSSIRTLAFSCFEDCTGLESLTLPEGLTTVAQNAISNTSLTTINIPSTCKYFNSANYSTTLKSFTVASGNKVLRGHEGVLYYKYEGEWMLWHYPNGKQEESYTVASYATVINDMAFDGIRTNDEALIYVHPNLKTIYIGKCRTWIDVPANINCEIVPSADNKYYKNINGLLYSKNGKILYAIPKQMTGTITIHSGVTIVAESAGQGGNYSYVKMPDTVKTVGVAAFRDARNLKRIDMSKNLENISSGMFTGCVNLKNVVIPDNIETIDESAFMDCSSLERIYIPKAVTNIRTQAFLDSGVKDVYYQGTEEEWNNIEIIVQEWFYDYLRNANIHYNTKEVPEELTKHYYDYENSKVVKEPTCSSEGVIEYECTECGGAITDSIPKTTDHVAGGWEVVKAATYSKEGIEKKFCTGCDLVMDERTISDYDIESIEVVSTAKISKGEKQTITINCAPVAPAADDVVWSSSNEDIAKVTSKGVVTAVEYGTATISAEIDGMTAVCEITVYDKKWPQAPDSAKAVLYGYDDVKFSWSKASGANGYTVYYKKASSDDSEYKSLGTTTKTYFNKANLAAGTKYDFKVVPYYKSGTKKYYDKTRYAEASVRTLKTVSTPTVEQFFENEVSVIWGDIEGETAYQVSQSSSKTGTSIAYDSKEADMTSTVVSATKGKPYYYKVRAYRLVGSTKIYTPWSAVTKYTIELEAPETVAAELSGSYNKAKITWDKVDGATGYYVYYKKATATKWTEGTRTTKLTYSKSSLSAGTTYDFKVVPYLEASSKKYVKSINFEETQITTMKALAAPSVVVDETDEAKVVVEWTPDEQFEFAGYEVSKSTSSSKTEKVYETVSAEEVNALLEATKGRPYYYKVRGYILVNEAKIYTPWSKTSKYINPLDVPEDVKAEIYGYNDVKVSWSKSPEATGYYVYYKKVTATKWTQGARTTKTYANIKDLTSGTEFEFKVVPYYKKSSSSTYHKSERFALTNAVTMKKLATPVVGKDADIDGNVLVTWKLTGPADAYEISRATSSSKTSVVATVEGGKLTSASIEGATKGKKYYYKVRAIKYVNGEAIKAPWSSTKAYTYK